MAAKAISITPASASAPAVDVTLSFVKATKGTYVFANEKVGLTGIYVPKALLMNTDVDDSTKLRLTLTPVE